jgi:putative colanic acid biosynthesis UDP-glucose lipid carrier transferase
MMRKKYITYDSRLFLMVDVLLSTGLGIILANLMDVIRFDYYLYLLLAVAFLQVFVFQSSYQGWRLVSISDHLKIVFRDWLSIALITIASLFLFKKTGDFSRLWLVAWICSVVFISVSLRLCLLFWLRKRRKNGENLIKVGLICDDVMRDYVTKRISAYAWSGYQVAQLVNLDKNSYKDLNIVNCQEIWIALPMAKELELQSILHYFRHHTIDIRYIPNIFSFRVINHGVSHMMDMTFINLSSTPLDNEGVFLKRIEDIILSIFFLIIFSPAMFFIALLLKVTSQGPILFKQKRNGWNGQEFYIYKFRTMYVHSEPIGELTQATVGDKRITSFGHFLRKTSLDELPQFFNVLEGTMSIVGPRPHAVEHNEYYKDLVPKYIWRNKVKPGITGWAQINGLRGETNTLDLMKKRVDYDLYYIENWSIWFDLRIIWLTLFSLIRGENAR